MAVRLNITIDERRLRSFEEGELPPKGISRFISDAVRARVRPGRDELDRAYQAAAKEHWRQAEVDDWSTMDGEGWPA